MNTPDRGPTHRTPHAYLRQSRVSGLNENGALRVAVEQEHVNACGFVRGEFVRSGQDRRISADRDPAFAPDIA